MDYTPLSTPSPLLVFPSASPTPKLSCTPSRKPPSPFDWPAECLLDGDQHNTTPSPPPPPLLTRRHSCTSTLRKNVSSLPRPVSIVVTSPAPLVSNGNARPGHSAIRSSSSSSQNRMLGNWLMRMKRAAEKPFRMIA